MNYEFKNCSADDFRSSILENGFCILRGAGNKNATQIFKRDVMEPAIAYWRTTDITDAVADKVDAFYGIPWGADFYKTFAKEHISDRMLRAFNGRSLYELVPFRVWSLLGAFVNGGELSPSVVSHSRAIHPAGYGTDGWSAPVQAHFDYLYHAEKLFTLNVWVPFDPVGTDAPTLQIAKMPLRHSIDRLSIERTIAPDAVEEMARIAQDAELETLVMEPGDIAVLTNWTVHRTHLTKAMTKGRLSAEIRICGPDDIFDSLRENGMSRLLRWIR